MKPTRRTAVGVIIAGIFGGQKATQQPTTAYYSDFSNPPPPPSNYYAPKDANLTADPFYRINRISKLQKIINGEFEEWQQEQLNNTYGDTIKETNINALKSISTVQKHKMNRDLIRENQKKQWIKEAAKELKELMRVG